MYNREYESYLRSKKWASKKIEVFGLKGRKCQRCSSEERIHVHHASYERLGNEDILNDLFVLCDNCHNEYHRRNKNVTIRSTKAFIKKKHLKKQSKKNKIDQILRSGYIPLRNKKYKVSRLQ